MSTVAEEMSVTTSMKLRAVMIAAYMKIRQNRYKDVPGKWHPDGLVPSVLSDRKERTWLTVPLWWLADKLREEVAELCTEIDPPGSKSVNRPEVLMEAGDVTAMAMMMADRVGAIDPSYVPKIVCLCGSTRFKDAFRRANEEETLAGNIVLSVGMFPHSGDRQLTYQEKARVDWLYMRKIDLCDEVLVLYIDQ